MVTASLRRFARAPVWGFRARRAVMTDALTG